MKLRDLLDADARYDASHGALDIAGMSADSRAIKPGFLFAAIPGSKADGFGFVPQALAAGAVAVMAERPRDPRAVNIAFVQVPNVRRALALAAAKFFPSQPATIAAITGTSGKTSVAAFARQIWAAHGQAAASIGTIGIVSPTQETYGSLTTPDPVDLHCTLARLTSEGVTHLAIEASSHGLDQHRLDGVRITAGAFTNITRDHLDYHPDFDHYLRAKLRLFETLIVPDGAAVIDVDHDHADGVVAAAKARALRLITVGRKGNGIRLLAVTIDGFTQRMRVEYAGQPYDVRLPLVGAFQVENALVAAGLVMATGGDAAQTLAALERLKGAKGRLERVGEQRGAPIFVDYAHKPDALEQALAALRPYVEKRLVVVFGAGGDRDRGKRPLMGEIAARAADHVIVTDDNPRSEDPATIRAAILAAAPGAIEIGDRREAIRTAIANLERGDVLLIAGKGHESGQIIGNQTLPFSDHEAVAAALGSKAA